MEELAGKRLIKVPKLYFRDTWVAADLLHLESYAAERGLTLGSGAIVGLGQGTEPGPLGDDLYYIAAESL